VTESDLAMTAPPEPDEPLLTHPTVSRLFEVAVTGFTPARRAVVARAPRPSRAFGGTQ
jgi:hypothetical protein